MAGVSGPRPAHARWRRLLSRLLTFVAGLALVLAGLFVLNGAVLADRERPTSGVTSHGAAAPPATGAVVRVLAYNVAKAFVHEKGLSFASEKDVRLRLARIAGVIGAERPDLVFLEEVVSECSRCPVDQVTELADATGMRFWAFGENYNLGIPFFRIVGGNAILSRWPIEPVGNPDLPGRKPFWVSTNNRRILWSSASIGGASVLLGAVHADSFSLAGGARQIADVLRTQGGRPAILAGDFNAEPKDESMRLVRESGLFSGEIDGGAPTHPSSHPTRRIDFVLAPRAWEHLGTRVIESDASDHAAVVADFRVR
jgi:endonuclease/exonuclease/phosphatase family metal-dependent hydrolase